MEKDMKISLLLDFYGSLLTPKQARAIELYYDDDLSLSEVAEDLSITRQGVRDLIARGSESLISYESSLGLLADFQRLGAGLRNIEENARKIAEISENGEISELARNITDTAVKLAQAARSQPNED